RTQSPRRVPGSAGQASMSELASKVERRIAAKLRGAIAELREERARAQQQHRHLLDGYTDLAAVGQAALGLSLESHVVLSQLTSSLADLRATLPRRHESAGPFAAVAQGLCDISDRLTMLAALENGTVRRR